MPKPKKLACSKCEREIKPLEAYVMTPERKPRCMTCGTEAWRHLMAARFVDALNAKKLFGRAKDVEKRLYAARKVARDVMRVALEE